MLRSLFRSLIVLVACAAPTLRAWDHFGHRIVGDLALASLPVDFPAFVREPASLERIGFLSGEPDRWSHAPDVPTKHMAWLEHFCDLEQIPEAGMEFANVPSLRYEFVTRFAAGRAAHPQNFPPIDPTRNRDQTRQWPGFLPWAITEHYGMLRAAFASLKVYEELGTREEITNTRANIVYLMGVMAHYVGDSAQPLHTTNHFNGWVGANPRGYTTWNGIHSWIDSGLIAKVGLKLADIAPRAATARTISTLPREDERDPVFVAVLDFMLGQLKLVEPLYQMEQAGKLGQNPEQTVAPEARAFIEAQLLRGGEMLGTIWLTAWRTSRPDTYLRGVLLRRQGLTPPPPAPKS